jgi:hypothetical protein
MVRHHTEVYSSNTQDSFDCARRTAYHASFLLRLTPETEIGLAQVTLLRKEDNFSLRIIVR